MQLENTNFKCQFNKQEFLNISQLLIDKQCVLILTFLCIIYLFIGFLILTEICGIHF